MHNIRVEESALRTLLEVVAAADVPPPIRVLVFEFELSEGEDGVFEVRRAEWSAFQIALFDVHVVVQLGVALIADHGEEKHV